MTDYERDMAAGGKPVMTDYERDLAAGAKPVGGEHAGDLVGTREIPLGVRAPDPEPTVGDRIMGAFKNAGHALGEAGSQMMHPVDLVTDPAKLSSLVRGVDDVVTLGAGQRVADWANAKLGREGLYASSEAERQDRGGGARTIGNLGGMFLPGAANAIVGAGTKAVAASRLGKLAPVGAIPGAALGTAKAVAGYEASAPVIAGGQAAVRGDNPIEAAYAAATDPVGLTLAGTVGAAAGGARGKAAAIRDPKTATGRVLADVEAAGGKVRPFGEPVRGGLYETPELSDLKPGRAGVNELASKAAGRSVGRAEQRYQAAQDAWGQKAEEVLADHHPDEIYKADVTHGALKEIDAENVVNHVVGDSKIAAAVDKVRRMLTSETDVINAEASANADKIIYETEPGGTVSDFMKVRKLVNKLQRHTTEPAERYVYGKVLGAMSEDAAAIDPRIGELNAEYRHTVESLKGSNDALFGQAKARIKDSESTRQAAAGRLGRVGDDTQAGTLAESRLERFGESDPGNARELRLMRAKKAAERLRYGEPEVSTSFEKGISRGAEHGAKKVAGAVLGHAAGGPIGAVVGHAAGGMLQSLPQAKLRLGLPAMEFAGRGTGVRAGAIGDQAEQRRAIDLIIQARQLEAELSARRARALGGR